MKAVDRLPVKPAITFGKFQNVDLRVAQVLQIAKAEGTSSPCLVLQLDAGHLGHFTSVGQYALVPAEQLLGRKVVICCNLSPRAMGPYTSQVLVLGTPHPQSPPDQAQAVPLYAAELARNGDVVF